MFLQHKTVHHEKIQLFFGPLTLQEVNEFFLYVQRKLQTLWIVVVIPSAIHTELFIYRVESFIS